MSYTLINKIIAILLMATLLLPLATAYDYSFVFKKSTDLNLNIPVFYDDMTKVDLLSDCTISIENPTPTLIVNNENMSYVSDGFFNYTLNNSFTGINGMYRGSVSCTDGAISGFSTFTFLITPSGTEPSVTQGILYSVLLIILVVLLSFSIIGAKNLDGNNEFDVGGNFIKINFNKYLKLGLFFLSYLLLIFIAFILYAISSNFMFLGFASDIFWLIHLLLWILLAPVFIAFVAVTLIKFVLDMRLDKLRERNLKPRKGGKKGW